VFQGDLTVLRDWAARYGVPTIEDRRGRWPCVLLALLAVAGLAGAAVSAAERGVIWPWAPTASAVRPACAALQVAGLDRYWPADTRIKERDEQDRHELGEYSYCWWAPRSGRVQDAPFVWLSVVVKRHSTYGVSSSIANAITSYTSDRGAGSTPQPVAGLGDEAFMASGSDEVLVEARRSNVTVSVDVDLDGDHQEEAQTAARALTTAILDGVRLA
jgi:hypothetical protein